MNISGSVCTRIDPLEAGLGRIGAAYVSLVDQAVSKLEFKGHLGSVIPRVNKTAVEPDDIRSGKSVYTGTSPVPDFTLSLFDTIGTVHRDLDEVAVANLNADSKLHFHNIWVLLGCSSMVMRFRPGAI